MLLLADAAAPTASWSTLRVESNIVLSLPPFGLDQSAELAPAVRLPDVRHDLQYVMQSFHFGLRGSGLLVLMLH